MKTLLFTLEYPPFFGGVANYYGNLVKFWPLGKEITVLDNNNNRLINPNLPWFNWLPAIFSLKRRLKRQKIDHVIVGHILPLGTATLLISKLINIKYSIIFHGLDFTQAIKTARKRWLTKIILKNSHKIICTNNYTAQLVKNFLPVHLNKKVSVVNPGIENRLKSNYNHLKTSLVNKFSLNDKIILLSVGRLIKRKGFDSVIKALPEVLKKLPNLVYIILGDGPELEYLKSETNSLGLDNRVTIIADSDDEQRDAWYNLAHLFIMTSKNLADDFEGFGIVYLEANLSGKPVIAGLSGGVVDAVINNYTGLLVNPENSREISQTIIKLASDKKLREKLGEQGRQRAIKEFNWQKQIKKLYSIIIL